MARTIPIDPILEKGYNVRLLVEDFDGLIEKWSNRSEKFRETVDSSLDCQYGSGEKDRDYTKIAEMAQQSGDILKVLNDRLINNNFVAGDQFTFGDIPLGVLIHKYFVLDIERPPLQGIEAWYERLKERPAFREHAMQPFGNSPSEFFALQAKGEETS